MKLILTLLVITYFLSACTSGSGKPSNNALYTSEAFTVYPDSVVQGSHVAKVISSTHITSNYQSPASTTFSRVVKVKFSINEKDNESPPGEDHVLVINGEKESPVMVFGEAKKGTYDTPTSYLPPNYKYTFRVDMRPVLEQFETKGYFEAYDGTRIAQADFKGFYIAGGSEPLSWDFVNLGGHGLQLQDENGDGIYEITLTLNPYQPAADKMKEWELSTDISHKPQYSSSQPLVDALYNLSVEEAIMNIEADSTFRTGAKWGGVWTRDISYSILLAFAYHEPEVAKISLMKKVKRGRIIQDTGSGGAWPISSDRMTWALAAWEIYKATGDLDWLEQAFAIISTSVEDD